MTSKSKSLASPESQQSTNPLVRGAAELLRVELRFVAATLILGGIGGGALAVLANLPFPPPEGAVLAAWLLSFASLFAMALVPIVLVLLPRGSAGWLTSGVIWIAPHGFWTFNQRRTVEISHGRNGALFVFFARVYRRFMRLVMGDAVICWARFADGKKLKVAWRASEFAATMAEIRVAAPRLVIGGSRLHARAFRDNPRGMFQALCAPVDAPFEALETVFRHKEKGAFQSLAHGAAIESSEDLLELLRKHPKKIVWIYAPEAFDGNELGGGDTHFVYAASSSGVVYAVPIEPLGHERIVSALSRLSPRAVVGYSEEREDLYRRDPKHPPDLTSEARQIVGGRCVVCDRAIVLESEGEACEECSEPIHRGCAEQHARDAHPDPNAHAFR